MNKLHTSAAKLKKVNERKLISLQAFHSKNETKHKIIKTSGDIAIILMRFLYFENRHKLERILLQKKNQ